MKIFIPCFFIRCSTFLIVKLILQCSICLSLISYSKANADTKSALTKPVILSTTGMIGSLVERLAPNSFTLITLMGSGTDPHLYKPSRSDIVKLMSANIILYSGNHLEGRMIDALDRIKKQGKKVLPLTEMIGNENLIESGDFQGNYDPHVWMDPVLWRKVVDVIREELIKEYPSYQEEIKIKSDLLVKDLVELDDYINKIIKTIPEKSRVLVTAHDAFSYFGKRYGLEVLGIQGISTESEASVNDIEKIVEILVSREIRAVFIESTVSEKNIKALLEGAVSKGSNEKFGGVKIGGLLFSDAMGKANTYEGTYIGMLDHNATLIVRSLGGNAPEKGMKGLLSNN